MEQLHFFNSKGKKENLNKVFIVSIEKICIGSLIFLVLWVLAFFWGYKRGIKVAQLQGDKKEVLSIDTKSEEMQIASLGLDISQGMEEKIVKEEGTSKYSKEEIPSESAVIKVKKESKKKTIKRGRIFYSIQLATYKNTRIARWYKEKLKREGFDSFLKEKNGFYVLYVGKFSDKGEARKIKETLRPRFPDCLIRTFSEGTT